MEESYETTMVARNRVAVIEVLLEEDEWASDDGRLISDLSLSLSLTPDDVHKSVGYFQRTAVFWYRQLLFKLGEICPGHISSLFITFLVVRHDGFIGYILPFPYS